MTSRQLECIPGDLLAAFVGYVGRAQRARGSRSRPQGARRKMQEFHVLHRLQWLHRK